MIRGHMDSVKRVFLRFVVPVVFGQSVFPEFAYQTWFTVSTPQDFTHSKNNSC